MPYTDGQNAYKAGRACVPPAWLPSNEREEWRNGWRDAKNELPSNSVTNAHWSHGGWSNGGWSV